MKYRRIFGCLASCLLLAGQSNAQQALHASSPFNPQQIFYFKSFPEKSVCSTTALERIFDSPGDVSLEVGSGNYLRGEIISRSHPNSDAETINISLQGFPQALFTLSRIRVKDKTVRFVGHILSMQSNDVLILQLEKKNYYFIKTEQRLLLTE